MLTYGDDFTAEKRRWSLLEKNENTVTSPPPPLYPQVNQMDIKAFFKNLFSLIEAM